MTDQDEQLPAGANGTPQEPDRTVAATDGQRQPRLPFPVVGVGASAGGLEAITELLQAMPAEPGLAVVFIQHLPPDRESMLVEILTKKTAMPVAQVEDDQQVEPNHVYVIRPGRTMTIRDGRLHLTEPLHKPGHGRPIDDFFRSLAEEQRQRAIGVILSGMGSNGSAGAQAIKVVGGMCVAQEPESAKYPSMPRSLIDAGLADFILRPAEIPEFLARYAAHPYTTGTPATEVVARREQQSVNEILAVLRTRTKHDFQGYRKPTIVRRIQRRMGLNQIHTLEEYARSLRQSPAEVTALADDLLIHVTGFFRDPEVWTVLTDRVVQPLVRERPDGQSIRAWVAACSSGEEAYTLAMLLVEAAEQAGKQFDIKVFATDMAERSLGHARAGIYPGGIESEIDPRRLERFFDRDESVYRIKKELRERVIFAPQNVLQDPPFSRLDIVSCRNLMIYLEPEVQRRVVTLLHFGLREGGTLLLGNSETVGYAGEELFEPIDKKHRIYRRVGPTRHGSLDFPRHSVGELARGPLPEPRPAARASVGQLVNKALLERHTPACVVVDRAGQVVYFHGRTELYLIPPRGEPTHDLLALTSEQIRGAVRIALQRVMSEGTAVAVRDGVVETPEGRFRIEIHAEPLEPRPASTYYLLTFADRPELPSLVPQTEPPQDDARLADELRRAREELQSTVEELQSSNEEMKASHEEVTSINEELQSTNEELETSKEELQSLNEELTTVNAQLEAKMEELERAGNDLSSLLASTDIAVVFLDQKFRIRRFTPAMKQLIDLIPSDIGRPLSDMAMKFTDPDLLPATQAVLDRLVPIEREILSQAGRWYLRRALPYRTNDNRIDGVVVTFVDITDRKQIQETIRHSEERFRTALEIDTIGVIFFKTTGEITEANEAFLRLCGYTRDDLAAGRLRWDVLTPPEWMADSLQAIEEFKAHGRTRPYQKEYYRKDGSRWWALFAATRLGENEGVEYVLDITEWKQIEQARRESEARYRTLAANLPSGAVFIVGPDLRYQLAEGEALGAAGSSPADFEGKTLREALGPERAAAHEPYYVRALNGEPFRLEHGADGRYFVTHGAPLRDGGKVTAVLAVSYDITDRKVAEEKLQISEELLRQLNEELDVRVRKRTEELAQSGRRYQALVEASAQVVWTTDAAGKVVEDSPSWRAFTGQSFDEWKDAGWVNLVHPDDRDFVRRSWEQAVRTATPLLNEFRIRHVSGDWRWTQVRAVPLREPDGSVRSWVGMNLDITDRADAEANRTDLMRRVVSAQEEVRRRISRELHDSLGQLLTALTLELRAAAAAVPGDSPAQSRLQKVQALNEQIMKEAHHLALELRPTTLDDIGLQAALSTYLEEWSSRSKISADLHCWEMDARLPPEVETAVYRIVQEALTNVVKHAGATKVGVILERQNRTLRVVVEDDGKGFDPDQVPKGGQSLGLFSIRERAAEFGGTLEVESAPGKGTSVYVIIPLPKSE